MSGRAGFSDDFHQRVLFNLFNSGLNEDHVLDTPASSQHLQGIKLKRNATPSGDNNYLLKPRKQRSKVWNDFRLDIKSDGKKKAICDHCNKEFVGESKKGTSHLLNHLKVCPEKTRKKEDRNKPSDNGNLTAHVVVGKKSTADLELSSLDLARSAIKREWKTFMDDLLHVYEDEKQKLCESFTKLSCRFSLTVDMVNHYGFVTVYYIDENWEMKRNILFLQDIWLWGKNLEKLRVFNLDESLCFIVWRNDDVRVDRGDIPGGVPFGDNFKGFVSLPGYIDYLVEEKEGYIDIVSRATKVGSVSDIIKNMLGYDLFEKVDKALRYVQSVLYDNDKHDLLTEIRVSLRGKKRDQSSFRMMMCALEYKKAFLSLQNIDCAFGSVRLTENEWDVVTAACDCLEFLNDVTCSLSSNKYRTANSCIHLILNIYKELLRLGSNDSKPRSYTEEIASRIRNNFIDCYWQDNSLVISIAAFFDPRFKMDLVRDWYNIIYPTEVEERILRFVNDLRRIYNFYANVPDNPTSSMSITSDALFGIPELDSYMRKEPPLDGNFEILAWWCNSTPHFSTLARMARDFLAVPICEINSETEYDMMRMHDPWLAFVWTKFWLQYSHHEVQILENPPSYLGQEITKTRQGNASSSCVNYEMVSHKQTLEYWSKLWNECDLTPNSYRRSILWRVDDLKRGYDPDTPLKKRAHLEKEREWEKTLKNLDPFRRSDLTTLVDTKKKFKVDCELDGSDLARMTFKLGHTAFLDNLLHVYKEEKQKAAKYLNELSCRISLDVSHPYTPSSYRKIITVQFIDEVWKLQRKILCLDLKGNGDCIGISPQELKAGRNLCSIVHFGSHFGDLEQIDDEEISRTKHLFHDQFFLPFSGNFQGIQSLSCYIDEFPKGIGAESVIHKMENILGCDIFMKITDCCEYVHKKFPYNDKFGEMKSIPCWYDHQSWGSAFEVRETFLELEGTDLDFKSINLTNKEWDALIAGYNCLKVFEDVTSEHLFGKEYTTANVCLPLICDMYESMQRKGSNNYYIHEIIEHLKETFVKDYWDGNGLALAIAAVLDPRFKMDVVEKWYNLIYGKEAEVRIQGFKEELRRCYNYYGDGSELDLYLRAPKRPIYDDFGILTWWRDSTSQFPTLARMARDILAIPVWSDNSAMIDEIQTMCCDLQDLDIRNAFICTPSWLESLKDK